MMMHEVIVRSVLHQLGIGKRYSGYDYIIHTIGLINYDERFLSCVTKVLYVTVAKNFDTSSGCVEKNIRRVIQIIWEDPENENLIVKFFGSKYVHNKPSNKEFLGMLYEYAESYNILEELFYINKTTCPFSQNVCDVYTSILDKLINL